MALQSLPMKCWIIFEILLLIAPKIAATNESEDVHKNPCSAEDHLCHSIFELKLETLGLIDRLHKKYPDLDDVTLQSDSRRGDLAGVYENEVQILVTNPTTKITEGAKEGATEGAKEGATKVPIEGATEVPIEGATEGAKEGATEVPIEGATEVPTEGAAEVPIEVVTEGATEVATESATEGASYSTQKNESRMIEENKTASRETEKVTGGESATDTNETPSTLTSQSDVSTTPVSLTSQQTEYDERSSETPGQTTQEKQQTTTTSGIDGDVTEMIKAVETIETDAAGSTIVSYKSTTTIPTAHKVDPTLAQSSTAVGVTKTTKYGVTKHETKSSSDDKSAITDVSSQLTSFSDDTAVSSTEFPPTIIRTTDTPTNYVEQTTSTGHATATSFQGPSSITPSLPPSSLASSVEVKADDPNKSTSPGTQRGLTGSPDETSSGPSTQSNVDAETETNDVNTEPSSTSLMKSTSRPTVKEEQSDSTAATPTVTTEATKQPPVTTSIDIVITPSIVDVPTIQPAAASSPSVTTSKRLSTDDDEFGSGEGPIFSTVPTHRDVTTPRLETTDAAASTKPTYSVFNVTGEKTVVEGHWTAHYDDNSTSSTSVTSGDITSKTPSSSYDKSTYVNVRDTTTRRALDAISTSSLSQSTATIEQEETSPTTKVLSSTPSDVMTTLSSSVSSSEKYEQDLSTRKATTEEDYAIRYADTTVDDVTSEVTATSPPKVTTVNDVTTHAITTPVGVTTKEAGTTVPPPPKDCYEIWQRGARQNGVYVIHPPAFPEGFGVFCDLQGQTGGWTVIQRRVNGSVNFYRPYFDYVLGFGNHLKEFYLGNEFIHALTNQHNYELLIILFDGEGNSRFANYRPFRLGDYSSDYQLFVRGYSGNAGNSLGYHSKSKFSTFDRDNDNNPAENCARTFGSGWWFADCDLKSNLNGQYLRGGAHNQRGKGITWKKWKGLDYSLKFAEMKIKPYGLL
ncbi:uncharacterized protein [Apostichopus japonicus]|uniref:uncharacterized protein isoform X2 n=1 Tax=Stichopus japonicus TaxID=307972 RepID=UPI003AB6F7AC